MRTKEKSSTFAPSLELINAASSYLRAKGMLTFWSWKARQVKTITVDKIVDYKIPVPTSLVSSSTCKK